MGNQQDGSATLLDVADAGIALALECFITDGQRLILPAFGAYAGGLNVRDAAFAGMFGRQPLAGVLGPSRVRAIGWRQLVGD